MCVNLEVMDFIVGPSLCGYARANRAAVALFELGACPSERRKFFQKLFEQLIVKWVSGDLVVDGVESW